ncbi:D-lactaldehyde dehydrogenase [Mycena floridula]|nr:D-lactaldehyde dehydrogenase [Mycena floridula]
MEYIPTGSKILISGASGFSATWAVRHLLENGYRVRGTVRSDLKGKFLSKMFSYGDKFEYIIESLWKILLKMNVEDPQDLIGPAHGTSVQHIIVTSSVSAISELVDEPKLFTENDWNEQSIQLVEQLGKDAPAGLKYFASKTLAEKAAWDFYNKHKSELSWELVVLCPGWVFGPAIHEVATLKSLNTSTALWYKAVFTEEEVDIMKWKWTWVDVRDLAEAHMLSLEKEAAGGERLILVAGEFWFDDWVNIANELPPSEISSRISKPRPEGSVQGRTYIMRLDGSKATHILGIQYRDMREMTKDMLAYFESRGW